MTGPPHLRLEGERAERPGRGADEEHQHGWDDEPSPHVPPVAGRSDPATAASWVSPSVWLRSATTLPRSIHSRAPSDRV